MSVESNGLGRFSWGTRLKQLVHANARTASVSSPAASRRAFIRRSTMLGVAGGAAALLLGDKKAMAGDVDERLEYTLKSVRNHELEHVDFLVGALGKAARPKPTFHNLVQPSMEMFLLVGQALENTGCGAYLGAAPIINNPDYLAAAGSIALIEARHASYFNLLQGQAITDNNVDMDNPTFESPLTVAQVVDAADGFIRSLNKGPALTFSAKASDANDIAILNFALALEYLEAEFYKINVRRFF